MSLLGKSTGVKRTIAMVLSVLLGVAQQFPGSAQIVTAIQWAASLFGIAGNLHAANAGTLKKYALPSVVAAIQSLILLAHFVPVLAPLVAPLQYLAALLGAVGVGNAISGK